MNSNTPNLFHFATKELSQDASICWLIEWMGRFLSVPRIRMGQLRALDLVGLRLQSFRRVSLFLICSVGR